jgi:uncharacterized membrane protein YgdD (TMEM256/DUF423 family)
LRIYNTYIVALVLASGLVNAWLAFLGQRDLGTYFIMNSIAYFTITLLYAYLNPRARTALNAIGIVLFAGFIVMISIRVAQIVSGR